MITVDRLLECAREANRLIRSSPTEAEANTLCGLATLGEIGAAIVERLDESNAHAKRIADSMSEPAARSAVLDEVLVALEPCLIPGYLENAKAAIERLRAAGPPRGVGDHCHPPDGPPDEESGS